MFTTLSVILQFRIFALYQQSRYVLAAMALLYLTEVVILMVVVVCLCNSLTGMQSPVTIRGDTDSSGPVNHEPFPGIRVCAAGNIPKIYDLFWPSILAFESCLFLLCFWVCVRDVRALVALKRWNKASLTTVLIRDSLAYFML